MYCPNCGTKNQEDAHYCKECGATIKKPIDTEEKQWQNSCERECTHASKPVVSLFWGILIIIIGLWIIFTILSLTVFIFFAIFPVLITIFVIIVLFRILTNR